MRINKLSRLNLFGYPFKLVIHLNLNCPDWSNVIKKSNVKCIACRKNAFYPGIMTTIQVNEPTKAGKALIETARIMAEKYKGIEFIKDRDPDEKDLLKKMLTAPLKLYFMFDNC